MLRQTLFNSTARVIRSSSVATRALSVSSARMAEGDLGGVRSGGSASSDAFNKREKANEDYYVKQKEKEKLLAVKAKLAEQQKHLDELSAHIDEMTKEAGGERN